MGIYKLWQKGYGSPSPRDSLMRFELSCCHLMISICHYGFNFSKQSTLSSYLMTSLSFYWLLVSPALTHWGRVTHICVSKLSIIASDNGVSPGRRQAIIWNNGGILSIGLLGTNFGDILFEILKFSFKKMHLKMSSVKWRLLRLGHNELMVQNLLLFLTV